jgi:hypothetical protein
MNTTLISDRPADAATFGSLADAVCGIATAVLAIIALTDFSFVLSGTATLVFGVALLMQGGALLAEYATIDISEGEPTVRRPEYAGDSAPVLLCVGVAGIVLGILALLGIAPGAITAAALVAYGSALLLSSGSVRDLYMLQGERGRRLGSGVRVELVAANMASGSARLQVLSGVAALVLGILALCGVNPQILTLVGLLTVGALNALIGGALGSMAMNIGRRTPVAS